MLLKKKKKIVNSKDKLRTTQSQTKKENTIPEKTQEKTTENIVEKSTEKTTEESTEIVHIHIEKDNPIQKVCEYVYAIM